MPDIIIEMLEAELFALDIIAMDKQVWADNALKNRARIAKDELKSDLAWVKAAVALAKTGGDETDDWAVLLMGRDLGLFKTAAEQEHASRPE